MSSSTTTGLSLSSNIQITEPFKVNPYAKEAEAKVEEYARKYGIYLSGFDHYNTVFAFLFPETSLEKLVVVGNLNCLLFYIDDVATSWLKPGSAKFEKILVRPEPLEPLIELFRYGQMPKEPTQLQLAFAELRQQFIELSDQNEEWLGRLANSLERYFVKTNRPAELLGDVKTLDLAEYIGWREDDSGMWTCIDTVEFTQGVYLPAELLENPILRQMQHDCVQIVALLNDVFSYHKEITQEGYAYNLVNIISQQRDLELKEAAKLAMSLINDIICDFYELEKELPDYGAVENALLAQYVQGLKYQIGTAWHWQLLTDRYRSPDSPFAELRN